MDCRFGRSNHSDIQYYIYTSNHKWTIPEIAGITANCTNLNGLQLWQILQFKVTSKINKTIWTNLNGFQWFAIQYVEWFWLVATVTICFSLNKRFASNFDSFQSIQSINFESMHWSETHVAYFDRSQPLELIQIYLIQIITAIGWYRQISHF